jgi:hypothetical protein
MLSNYCGLFLFILDKYNTGPALNESPCGLVATKLIYISQKNLQATFNCKNFETCFVSQRPYAKATQKYALNF